MRKNYRKIPDCIKNRQSNLQSNSVIVSVTIKTTISDILNGKYSKQGITVCNNQVLFKKNEFLPSEFNGKFSRKNINGDIITRRDLPKVWKTFNLGDRPIWGDWSKGSFSLTVRKLVYKKETIQPTEKSISLELLKQNGDEVYIKVSINEILEVNSKNYESELLFNINLLQEFIGCINLFSSNADLQDYLNSLYVNWEFLPIGTRDENILKLLNRYNNPSAEIIGKIEERYGFLESLNPLEIITGTSGFIRYFGAKFSNELVVFENLDYGNAIYIMFENWEVLSRLSRLELRKLDDNNFVRISHSLNWKQKTQEIVKERLDANNIA